VAPVAPTVANNSFLDHPVKWYVNVHTERYIDGGP